MSFIFPIVIEKVTNSNFTLGIIITTCSIISLCCDFTLPQLFRHNNWKLQFSLGISSIIFFPLLTIVGGNLQSLWFLTAASFFWAFAYEIVSFAQQNFIAQEEEKNNYSRAWGILYVAIQLASITGIFIAPFLLKTQPATILIIILSIICTSLITSLPILIRSTPRHAHHTDDTPKINFSLELKFWRVFLKRFWPVVTLGFWFGVIDAVFWTYGGLFGIQLLRTQTVEEALPMLFYIGPSLLGAFLLSRFGIVHNKKHYSHISLFLAGISLAILLFVPPAQTPTVPLAVILAFGFFVSFAKPLNDATYSDLMDRTDDPYDQHLLGLAKSNDTFSYLVGPIIAGFVIDRTSYQTVFGGIGVITILVSLLLITATHKKLFVPHRELEALDSEEKTRNTIAHQ